MPSGASCQKRERMLAASAEPSVLLVTVGLWAPAVCFVAAAVGLLRAVGLLPSFGELRAALGAPAWPAAWLSVGLVFTLGWLVLGELALVLLTTEGLGTALRALVASLGSLSLLVGLSFAEGRLRERLTRWFAEKRPPWAAVWAPVVVLVLIALLIAVGETSGRGHALALLGVFKRPELDLSLPLSLLGLALAAAALVAIDWGARGRWLAWGGGAAVLLGLFGSLAAAVRMTPRQALHVERQGGLAALTLRTLSRLTDGDRDGVSDHFGGGDCDDARAEVFPGAVDVPENGIDEDCSGADAKAPAPAAPSAPEAVRAVSGAGKLPERPNVLLLTVDTLRFDLGYQTPSARKGLSPRLDELASRCTVFERGYALASYTSKSLAPMLIGRYSSETLRTFEHFDRFDPSVPFLQERIHARGHRTLSAQAYWYFFLKGYGFERGWDVLDKEAAPKQISIDGDARVTGDKLADRAIALLEAEEGHSGQFFAWAHWVDPHSEYVPHAEFDFGKESRERYDGEVAFVDQQIGRVLDALAKRSYADRTIVLFTSDHGEAFGEHGMIRHGFEIWDELVRVPLLLCIPGVPASRISEPRSIIDVGATLADIFELEVTPPDFIRGQSLVDDALRPPGEPAPARPVLVDMPKGPNNLERRALIDGKYKLILSGGLVSGLYDLEADPGEKKDLSDQKELVQPIKEKLAQFWARLHLQKPR